MEGGVKWWEGVHGSEHSKRERGHIAKTREYQCSVAPFVRRRDDSGEFSVELRCELGRPCRTVIHRFILLSWGEQRRASLGLNFLLLDLFLLLLLLIFVLGRLWVDPLGPTLRENVLHMVGPPCHCRVQKSRFADTLVFL
jgi:hypothetical protein